MIPSTSNTSSTASACRSLRQTCDRLGSALVGIMLGWLWAIGQTLHDAKMSAQVVLAELSWSVSSVITTSVSGQACNTGSVLRRVLVTSGSGLRSPGAQYRTILGRWIHA